MATKSRRDGTDSNRSAAPHTIALKSRAIQIPGSGTQKTIPAVDEIRPEGYGEATVTLTSIDEFKPEGYADATAPGERLGAVDTVRPEGYASLTATKAGVLTDDEVVRLLAVADVETPSDDVKEGYRLLPADAEFVHK